MIVVGEMNREEIMFKLDLRHRQHFQKNYIEPSIQEKLIEMTLPDKLTSKNQKYRLTKKGIPLQNKLKNGSK
jgi:ATP-dependent DNA helicase RecG